MNRVMISAENVGLRFRIHPVKRRTIKYPIIRDSDSRRENDVFWALRNVNFIVRQGETLGLIGSNGSGKSTLLRVIGKIYHPDEGHIETNGRVSTLLSLTPGIQPDLNGLKNIYLVGMLMGLSHQTIQLHLNEIVEFAELGDFIEVPVKKYSSGMLARLGFAIASHLDGDILLMDEILGVGDKAFRAKSRAKIRDLLRAQRAVVLVSHNMEAIHELTTQCIWLEKGVVRACGPTDEVVTAYQRTAF